MVRGEGLKNNGGVQSGEVEIDGVACKRYLGQAERLIRGHPQMTAS